MKFHSEVHKFPQTCFENFVLITGFFSPQNDEVAVDRQLVDDCSVLGVHLNLTPEWDEDDDEEAGRRIESKSDDVSFSSDIPMERLFVFSVTNLIQVLLSMPGKKD